MSLERHEEMGPGAQVALERNTGSLPLEISRGESRIYEYGWWSLGIKVEAVCSRVYLNRLSVCTFSLNLK